MIQGPEGKAGGRNRRLRLWGLGQGAKRATIGGSTHDGLSAFKSSIEWRILLADTSTMAAVLCPDNPKTATAREKDAEFLLLILSSLLFLQLQASGR